MVIWAWAMAAMAARVGGSRPAVSANASLGVGAGAGADTGGEPPGAGVGAGHLDRAADPAAEVCVDPGAGSEPAVLGLAVTAMSTNEATLAPLGSSATTLSR